MAHHLINNMWILIKKLSLSQCGEYHEPREQSKGSAKHLHPQHGALKLVNVPHEDVQRHFGEIWIISLCNNILTLLNLSHIHFPDGPAVIR